MVSCLAPPSFLQHSATFLQNTVLFKSKLTLDSQSSHESRILLRIETQFLTTSRFSYLIPARLTKPERLLFEFRVTDSQLSILDCWNGLCESFTKGTHERSQVQLI